MENKLFLVTGHSGSGKSTIMKSILHNEIISFTTREKRIGEQEGIDYKFITIEQFNHLQQNNKLIESVEYSDNFYGVDSDEMFSKLDKGHAFCIVDYHGMLQMKSIYRNCCTIFLYTDEEQARQQMLSRGDEEAKVSTRMKTYSEEMKNKKYYDYVIKNNYGQLDRTKLIFKNIIESEVFG